MRSLSVQRFQSLVYEHYDRHGRHDLAWRKSERDGSFDPYKILISEVMLQQTQVSRVIPKYQEFLAHYPTLVSLPGAPLSDVLRLWSGLGYNRRAQYLHRAAQQIVEVYDGRFPDSQPVLTMLPGVGSNTAGAILAYAYNQPVVFLETNIRTVFIHHFFHDEHQVSDTEILKLVTATLDRENPRHWYWALMDYGSSLKREVGNLNRLSTTYKKQSKFQGSRRQIRGQVIRELGTGRLSIEQLQHRIADDRLTAVVEQLVSEKLVQQRDGQFSL